MYRYRGVVILIDFLALLGLATTSPALTLPSPADLLILPSGGEAAGAVIDAIARRFVL
jgi:hypothetical protein